VVPGVDFERVPIPGYPRGFKPMVVCSLWQEQGPNAWFGKKNEGRWFDFDKNRGGWWSALQKMRTMGFGSAKTRAGGDLAKLSIQVPGLARTGPRVDSESC